jgi:hypothetical protein
VNIDSQWNEWCAWNGADWDRTANVLSWTVLDPVDVLVVPWELMMVDCNQAFFQVFLEMWITQDGGTKGPLDLSFNDDLQLSTPGGTTWDIDQPVIISCYHCIDLYGPSGTEATTWTGVKSLWK